jgi:hypothetical protein
VSSIRRAARIACLAAACVGVVAAYACASRERANVVSAPAGSEVAASSPASTVDASSEPPAPKHPPGIACGSETCTAGEQICCVWGNGVDPPRGFCVSKTPANDLEREHAFSICERYVDSSYSGAWFGKECDDSTDCGEGRVCCANMWGSGQPDQIECRKLAGTGVSTCDYYEPCTKGAPCSTPGATCVDGRCVPHHNDRVACGASTCTPEEPICCLPSSGGAPRCTTLDACPPERGTAFECTRASDCSPGEGCKAPSGYAVHYTCYHFDDGMMAHLCDVDSDCADACNVQEGYCDHGDGGWPSFCSCR